MDGSALLFEREGTICYLGYPLSLGKRERAVLSVLMQAQTGLDTVALAAASGADVSAVSALVASINRKAANIGERTLILSGRAKGYRLAEFL